MRRESAALGRSAPDQPVLIWERSGHPAMEFELGPGRRLTIGRGEENAVVMPSSFVSKAHAVLQHRDGQYVIEDLGSANGTRVNGAPVRMYTLGPGDVIEVGDQRLVFVDRARARPAGRGAGAAVAARLAGAASGGSKATRLAIVAAGTMLLVGGGMLLLVKSVAPPAPEANAPPPSPVTVGGDAARPIRPDSALVRRIEAQAAAAGVRIVDALYDEGLAQLKSGRPREAAHLFAAALRHDGRHVPARARLEEARLAWERAIVDHLARADRAFGELRYDDAILEWEQVLLLADEGDPRLATARTGVDRARRLRQSR
jgi:hypothetical protein